MQGIPPCKVSHRASTYCQRIKVKIALRAKKDIMRNSPEVRDQMFKQIQEWHVSGLSQKAFCEQQSIRYHVFHYWYKRYREQHANLYSNPSPFVKLQIAKAASAGSVEINYPGGIRITFHEAVSSNYLKELVG